jgi:hypothetical protein
LSLFVAREHCGGKRDTNTHTEKSERQLLHCVRVVVGLRLWGIWQLSAALLW